MKEGAISADSGCVRGRTSCFASVPRLLRSRLESAWVWWLDVPAGKDPSKPAEPDNVVGTTQWRMAEPGGAPCSFVAAAATTERGGRRGRLVGRKIQEQREHMGAYCGTG